MDPIKKLFSALPSASSSNSYVFKVKCNRCGEVIEGRVNLVNDLSLDDKDNYFVRKVLMGSGRCFQQVEIELKFDASRQAINKPIQLIDKKILGGTFLD
ncbi:MAG: hypothetical protein HY258_05875 [Chloroflexi bacterium]|nr:hypothetical protein [Chloroflexota bacterium]